VQIIKFADHKLEVTFAPHSLRVTHSPSEGSMMIDESTRNSLELIQNLERPNSKACLFGFMNRTVTPMGARYLRSNILQPATNTEKIVNRLNAVAELSSSEEVFVALKKGESVATTQT
jgi:DNA mismatch repair protein MSH4